MASICSSMENYTGSDIQSNEYFSVFCSLVARFPVVSAPAAGSAGVNCVNRRKADIFRPGIVFQRSSSDICHHGYRLSDIVTMSTTSPRTNRVLNTDGSGISPTEDGASSTAARLASIPCVRGCHALGFARLNRRQRISIISPETPHSHIPKEHLCELEPFF